MIYTQYPPNADPSNAHPPIPSLSWAVITASRLMFAAAALRAIEFVVEEIVYRLRAHSHQYSIIHVHHFVGHRHLHPYTITDTLFNAAAAAIVISIWIFVALGCRGLSRGARIIATILFSIKVMSELDYLAHTHSAPIYSNVSFIFGVFMCLIGLRVIILLWSREANLAFSPPAPLL